MSDSLDDRLEKQKAAGSAKQQAYLTAMRERVARDDAQKMADRIPRAEAHFEALKAAIATRIGKLARAKKGQPGLESLTPFEVSNEFDGTRNPTRDVRLPDDSAHAVWLAFVEWGQKNGLAVDMVAMADGHMGVRVAVA